jgi:hypothetical protein
MTATIRRRGRNGWSVAVDGVVVVAGVSAAGALASCLALRGGGR